MSRSRIAKYLFSQGKQSLLKINAMAKDERGSISILILALFLITINPKSTGGLSLESHQASMHP
jgi:hypothetical protein